MRGLGRGGGGGRCEPRAGASLPEPQPRDDFPMGLAAHGIRLSKGEVRNGHSLAVMSGLVRGRYFTHFTAP